MLTLNKKVVLDVLKKVLNAPELGTANPDSASIALTPQQDGFRLTFDCGYAELQLRGDDIVRQNLFLSPSKMVVGAVPAEHQKEAFALCEHAVNVLCLQTLEAAA